MLKAWMFAPEHVCHPYPTTQDKKDLAEAAGITEKQLSNWFVNARKRLWLPLLRRKGMKVDGYRFRRACDMKEALANHQKEPSTVPTEEGVPPAARRTLARTAAM